MRSLVLWLSLVALAAPAAFAAPAHASDADRWFDALTDRVVDELAAGKPLVIQAHVPLCDRHIIACGNTKLGDGEAPDDNLYWATDEGFVGWLGRRHSGWTQVLHADGTGIDRDVLDVRVWTRTVAASAAWRKRGVPAKVAVYVVAFAWRGKAIDRALATYWSELYGTSRRDVTLADGTVLGAGGAAQIIAYVGHNRLYDVAPPDWSKLEQPGAPVRGTFAIACNTGPFMADHVSSAQRVPLLYTNDFLMASAGAFEGAVLAFATGGDYRAIRQGAASGYATAGNHDLRKIGGVFTNPADRRWGHWANE